MDPTFLLFIAIAFGAMWLMTSRTRKQQKQAVDFRANLAVGQDVMTGSGMLGTVVAIDGDEITLESTPGNRSRWLRAAIAKLVEAPVTASAEEDVTVVDEDPEPTTSGPSLVKGTPAASYDVPDDLSTLPPARGDDTPDQK
ncbi:preprotein translocase subunit YajC [Cellulomonas cellasea]|uniref:Preprotein translocase subunit YajC n=1 Tax=Cellulomonas cellasea TaxID=43670 RepID=A0A7W4UCU3_9CELL|nr:preprotein translocase subunit YajC [Cellulomonas cellasea]MBB2921831.1 preprotein translocase subunit YajC [Cellulomonas cellasea]